MATIFNRSFVNFSDESYATVLNSKSSATEFQREFPEWRPVRPALSLAGHGLYSPLKSRAATRDRLSTHLRRVNHWFLKAPLCDVPNQALPFSFPL